MKNKKQNRDELVAKALRQQAQFFIDNKDKVTVEQGRVLDRALRSCKGIVDMDIVWPRWSYFAEKLGWLTEDEMEFDGKTGTYYYPEKP